MQSENHAKQTLIYLVMIPFLSELKWCDTYRNKSLISFHHYWFELIENWNMLRSESSGGYMYFFWPCTCLLNGTVILGVALKKTMHCHKFEKLWKTFSKVEKIRGKKGEYNDIQIIIDLINWPERDLKGIMYQNLLQFYTPVVTKKNKRPLSPKQQ